MKIKLKNARNGVKKAIRCEFMNLLVIQDAQELIKLERFINTIASISEMKELIEKHWIELSRVWTVPNTNK